MANSVPTLTGLTTPVTFLENTVNGAPQIIAADVTFTDADNNFDTGTLTVADLLAQDTVAIRNQGGGAGEIGVAGSNVSFGGTVIGSFAGGAGSTLTVTFNAAATAAAIEALIENLTYANSSDTPTANRSLELKVTDAAGFAAIAPLAFTQQAGAANPLNGVDVGNFSAASFADLDGDGDLDAVVGDDLGHHDYFQNTGTAIAPAFAERTGAANPFNGVDFQYRSTPSFADLDGDGDFDAIVGDNNGTLHYFQNTGSATAPVFTERTGAANPLNGGVGYYSAPSFADLDGDGDLDALVGDLDGILHFPEHQYRHRAGLHRAHRRRQSLRRRRCRFPRHAELRRPRRRRRPRCRGRGTRRHPALFREHRHGHRASLHLAHRRRQSVQRRRCGERQRTELRRPRR